MLSWPGVSWRPKDPKGAGEGCFRGLYEVSLALVGVEPPRLDSNNRIVLFRMQQFFVGCLKICLPQRLDVCNQHHMPIGRSGLSLSQQMPYSFLTSMEAHSSKTRIDEQKSSSPQPFAIAARSICSVSAVIGRGTS